MFEKKVKKKIKRLLVEILDVEDKCHKFDYGINETAPFYFTLCTYLNFHKSWQECYWRISGQDL